MCFFKNSKIEYYTEEPKIKPYYQINGGPGDAPHEWNAEDGPDEWYGFLTRKERKARQLTHQGAQRVENAERNKSANPICSDAELMRWGKRVR